MQFDRRRPLEINGWKSQGYPFRAELVSDAPGFIVMNVSEQCFMLTFEEIEALYRMAAELKSAIE